MPETDETATARRLDADSAVDEESIRGIGRLLVWALLGALGTAVGYAMLSLPDERLSLGEATLRQVGRSGVEHAVTAVLMNFRAYDTLLEIAVLLLALLAVWSVAVRPARPHAPPGLVLEFMNQLLVPFLILFAGVLLWAGATAPGGAFQAGAVLAAAGVIATLSGLPLPDVPPALQRSILVGGLGLFVVVGTVTLCTGRAFLEYSPAAAKVSILAIESAATLSIGLKLLGIFRGGRPSPGETVR